MSLENLFSPVSIGSLRIENRIVMPPMATNYATIEGYVTERQIEYYVERAKGGVGYITAEHTGILEQGKASPKMLLISSDKHASSYKKLVDAVHGAGGKIFVQINHAGRQTMPSITGAPIVGPSPISHLPNPPEEMIPKELSTGEIESLVQAYTNAAQRVKEIGADGVEIHMAHGYLICAFLSPFSNKRTDAYGGDVQGRLKFAVEILNSVRNRVGNDFPISCRLSGDEFVEGGLDTGQTVQIAKTLEAEGADVLHISAANAASVYANHPPYYLEEGVFVNLAQAVKSVVNIPVITVGRIRNPQMADQIIRAGKADLVSMGRALIADPSLPNKARNGLYDEIVPCISCNKCIQTLRKDAVQCSVNPEAGNEAIFRFQKADRSKKVWIIGGGPGGLKAAEIASVRGHEVTLYEKENRLGGRVRVGATPPHKGVLNEFVDYLERRIRATGVTIELGKTFTPHMFGASKPDVLVVATGASPKLPEIQGIETGDVLNVDEALSDDGKIGKTVLVAGGGGTGAEIADFLSEQGKRVTIVEMLDSIASDLVIHLQHYLLKRLKEKQVEMFTGTRIKSIGKDYVEVEDGSGTRRLKGFDTIILAVGGETPNAALYENLKGKIGELYIVGDAAQPREIIEAVFDGQKIAGGI